MKSALIEELARFGCDTGGALERLLDDEELYIDCVRAAADEMGDLSALAQAIRAGDAKEAFEIAHYFKGAVANLGLTPVLEPVEQAIQLFRNGSVDGGEALLAQILVQCGRLNKILSADTAGIA